MHEAVHPYPSGESTASRAAATAGSLGYDGLVLRRDVDDPADRDVDRIAAEYGIDVVEGVEVAVDDPARASGYVGSVRPRTTVLLLRGESTDLNRFAVNQERVDVLADPMAGGDLNHVLVKAAKRHDVRLEVNLGRVLRESGGRRVRALSSLRKLRELLDAYDAPFVVSGDPGSHLELRAPRELLAVGEAVGFEPEAIERGLAEWGRIADANRDRRSASFVEPGVELADGTVEEESDEQGRGKSEEQEGRKSEERGSGAVDER